MFSSRTTQAGRYRSGLEHCLFCPTAPPCWPGAGAVAPPPPPLLPTAAAAACCWRWCCSCWKCHRCCCRKRSGAHLLAASWPHFPRQPVMTAAHTSMLPHRRIASGAERIGREQSPAALGQVLLLRGVETLRNAPHRHNSPSLSCRRPKAGRVSPVRAA